MQVYKGHAHEEEVKRFSPLLAELIEYPDKKNLELVLEVCMYAYTYIHTCIHTYIHTCFFLYVDYSL